MNNESFSISLRIWHPALSSQEVVDSIALPPEFSQSVGQPRVDPGGKSLGGVYRSTYCSFLLQPKVIGVFTDQLQSALGPLQIHAGFLQRLATGGGRAELFVGVFAEDSTGFTLDVGSMKGLLDLSLELSVEVY